MTLTRRVASTVAPATIIGPRSIGSTEVLFYLPAGSYGLSTLSWTWPAPVNFKGSLSAIRLGSLGLPTGTTSVHVFRSSDGFAVTGPTLTTTRNYMRMDHLSLDLSAPNGVHVQVGTGVFGGVPIPNLCVALEFG